MFLVHLAQLKCLLHEVIQVELKVFCGLKTVKLFAEQNLKISGFIISINCTTATNQKVTS